MSRPHIAQLTICDRTITFEEYAALSTREARYKFREGFIDILGAARREEESILKQIRLDVEAQFAPELVGVPRSLPGALTKTGKPDKRFGTRVNSAWRLINNRQEALIKELSDRVAPITSTYRFPYQFEEVLNTWEAAVQTPMEELKSRLGSHDWYFHYSDDYGVFTAGQRAHDTIRALVSQLGPEAGLMYNRACPWLNEDGTHKKDAA
jgi:hypothetical protein